MPSRALVRAAVKAANTPTVTPVNPNLSATYGGMWGASREYANFLPRPREDFTAAGFAPQNPIFPMGIDEIPDGSERPPPRRFPYPVAWNMPVGVPGGEGLGKLADFTTLRLLAEYSSIARACIQLRKAEIRGLAWSIVPTKDAAKSMRGNDDEHSDFSNRKAEAVKFFSRPDPNYSDFSSWLDAALETVFVLDALSIYLQPTRVKGKGLLGSSLAALCLIDGSTIRPLVDVHGARPRPPAPAFQQYIYGVPRVDLMTIISGDDEDELKEPVTAYRGDQLMYLPMSPRDWSPYGQAPAERCIIPIMASLQRQNYQLQYFTEGTVPSVFVSPGDVNMTPQQVANLQNTLNAIAGDPSWKHKMIVLPGGSNIQPMHQTALADQFDEIIAVQVCMGYDVMPMELGISPKVSTTQSSGASNQMAKANKSINDRKSLKPLLSFLKTSIFDQVLQQICGCPDMEWKWEGLEEGDDEADLVNNLITQVNAGLISHDEARLEIGREPWGLPITADPGVITGSGFVPLGAIDPATGLPAAVQPDQPAVAGEVAPSAPDGGNPAPSGGAKPKPKPGNDPGKTPSHAGSQAAMGQHGQQSGNQAAKPKDNRRAGGKPVNQQTGAGKPADSRQIPNAKKMAQKRSRWASADTPLSGKESEDVVYSQLVDDYPADAISWVHDATWTGPVQVSVDQIDMSSRSSWQASDEPDKVDRFKRKIKHKTGKGKPVKPVVLVQTPKNSKLIVVDGHHRTLAYEGLGMPVTAWIGLVNTEKGQWNTMHTKQYPNDYDKNGPDGDTRRQVKPSRKAALAELDALSRHIRKGRDPATWEARHLTEETVSMIVEVIGQGIPVEQVIEITRLSIIN